MKPWNTWVAWLGCAGLCLALVGCGGSSASDPDSDLNAAKGTLPSAAPAAAPVAPSAPEPAPAPAPEPAPAAAPAPAPAPAPAAAEPKPEEPAASKPADPAATATGSPAPDPATNATAKADNNPFAVFSETQTTPPAKASSAPGPSAPGPGAPAAAAAVAGAPEVPPQDVPPPADAPAAADGNQGPLGFLEAAAANRGERKLFTSAWYGANAFLDAVKKKDLNKVAQATALRAATESKNQKLFQLILSQELAQEDLDELAKKLAGFQVSGSNVAKSTGIVGITVTKSEGTSIMRRNLTMRHEKAGWKVQDIGGEGELEKPIIMPRMGRGGMRGGGRR